MGDMKGSASELIELFINVDLSASLRKLVSATADRPPFIMLVSCVPESTADGGAGFLPEVKIPNAAAQPRGVFAGVLELFGVGVPNMVVV